MRVGHEIAHVLPGGKNATLQDAAKRSAAKRGSAGLEDTVQISTEARDLHMGQPAREREITGVGPPEENRFARIRDRIDSGFYELTNTRLALAEEVLSAFGL